MDHQAYRPRVERRTRSVSVRGLSLQLQLWGDPSAMTPERPALVLVHGWMDVGASFQFVVDALAELEGEPRYVLAPDLRGFGGSESGGSDSYWFPDYLGDLDRLLQVELGAAQVDLLGHSMGGNVAMLYAGLRPARVRRLINLEGFGLPQTESEASPKRLTEWLDSLAEPQVMRTYATLDEVAARLRGNNPLLAPDKAAWLSEHWCERRADGRLHILGDPAHKRPNPILYRVEEVLACWRAITAPLLWVEGEKTMLELWWGKRYSKREFHERLQVVRQVDAHVLPDAGHMLHHDQPERLAQLLARFLA